MAVGDPESRWARNGGPLNIADNLRRDKNSISLASKIYLGIENVEILRLCTYMAVGDPESRWARNGGPLNIGG